MIDDNEDEYYGNVKDRYIPPIVESVSREYIENFQPVYKRYYDSRYCTNFSTPNKNLDTCVRIHSNKVSVVYLSPKHSIFEKKQTIQRLNFQITPKLNRLKNEVKGKAKRGAQFLNPDSILCFIETEDGDTYTVRSGIFGKLLEINENILSDPNLILKDILHNGFIAIVLQDLKKFDHNLSLLVQEEDYNKNKIEPSTFKIEKSETTTEDNQNNV